MIRFFRRTRPAAPERMTVSEAITASAWGYDETGWLNLTQHQRAHARTNLTKAPYFKDTK